MFALKTRLALALLLVFGGVYSAAQARKIAPLSAKESKLTKCSLHNTPLQLGTAVILYGRRGDVVPQFVSLRQFPRASTHRFGGCVVSNDSPAQQQVKFCPQCRAAETRWLKSHNIPFPTR